MAFVTLMRKAARLDVHHRLLAAVVCGVLLFLILEGRIGRPTQAIACWDVSVIVYLAIGWATLVTAEPMAVRQTATLNDVSRTILFVVVVAAACVGFLAVGLVLGPSKGLSTGDRVAHVVLSAAAIICSWLLIHTVFALRYAHIFYTEQDGGNDGERTGGLEFPGTSDPDYMDFVYFSFVIGMTFQVSDVQIVSRRLRRYALIHGLISFAFNTIILALTINVVSSLI